VTAAYCVVFGLVLAYVVIVAFKLERLEREGDELAGRAEVEPEEERAREPAQVG